MVGTINSVNFSCSMRATSGCICAYTTWSVNMDTRQPLSGWIDISLGPWGRDETPLLTKTEKQTPETDTKTSWLLNKRHYGSLQGQSRQNVYFYHYGNKQIAVWHRDYRARPPLNGVNDPNYPSSLNPTYQHVERTRLECH